MGTRCLRTPDVLKSLKVSRHQVFLNGFYRSSSILFCGSPAAHSPAKLADPETYWFASAPREDHDKLRTLLSAVQGRAPNRILEQMTLLAENHKAYLLGPVHLELIIRAMRPGRYFQNIEVNEVHETYQSRMTFIRKFINTLGAKLSRNAYVLLLEEARLLRLRSNRSRLANDTWADMEEAGIRPNVHCYNAFIAATCIQPSDLEKFPLRKRNRENKHRTIVLQKAEQTVQKAVSTYHEMIKRNIEPNAMTIELLILALGHASNLSALRLVILQTWNMSLPEPVFDAMEDQEVPDEYEEEGVEMTDQLPSTVDTATVSRESVLFPTQKSLLAIAMAFGILQQNTLALNAVRNLAQLYGLPISAVVWTELMKWAAADSESLHGFTSRGHVEELYRIAIDVYKERPSISMYSVVVRHLLKLERGPSTAYEVMDQMLSDVDSGETRPRLRLKNSDQATHARVVAMSALKLMQRTLSMPIRQLTRRLATARMNGGVDEIWLIEQDLSRRSTNLRDAVAQWQKRLGEFDERISKSEAIPSHKSENDMSS